jgi:hypothetical protein
MRAWQIPLRLATGAYILNSGLEKRHLDTAAAEHLQGFAAGAYPVVKRMPPERFAKALSTAEIAIGAGILSPFVSSATAGLLLGGFSGSLLNLYWKTPGLHREGDPRPTPDGVPIAKDVWMAGGAFSLLIGSIGGSSRSKRKRAKAKAKAKVKTKAHTRAAAAASAARPTAKHLAAAARREVHRRAA